MNVDIRRVTRDSRLIDDVGLDSVAFAVGMVAIEDRLGVALTEEDLLSCETVGDLEAAVLAKAPAAQTNSDAAWLADLGAHGLLRASLVPPAPIRRLRDLTRTRTTLTRDRAREVQRIEKILEDAGIKLSSVATDIMGQSPRAMLDALPLPSATDPTPRRTAPRHLVASGGHLDFVRRIAPCRCTARVLPTGRSMKPSSYTRKGSHWPRSVSTLASTTARSGER